MQIILLTNGKRKTFSFSISQSNVMIAIVCGFVLTLTGYFLLFNGQSKATETDYLVNELTVQRVGLERMREKTHNTLDSLALRVGQMQAQLMRLNAVGSHLAKKAKLNSLEFDFDQPAATGGVEAMALKNSFTESQLLEDIQSLPLF